MKSQLAVTSRTPKVELTEKQVNAFAIIVDFIKDLWDVFGDNTVTPLALYFRLTQHIKPGDVTAITKSVLGFHEFLQAFDLDEDLSPEVKIRYGTSDKVYLEIGKYFTAADDDMKSAIRRYFLTISAVLEPNKEKIEKMTQFEKKVAGLNINTDTAEGKFINGIMSKAKTTMENVHTDDPMKAMMSIFSSGVVQDMVVGLQQGVGSGQMNTQRLLSTMQSAISALMPVVAPPGQSTVEEVQDADTAIAEGVSKIRGKK